MEIFRELLGFIVLTGPLFLIIPWFLLSIWVAIKAYKRREGGWIRVILGLLIFATIMLIPFADSVMGRLYLNYLCSTDAGVKIYQTVSLPSRYWDGSGMPRFIKKAGSLDFDKSMVGDRYVMRSRLEPFSRSLNIDRDSYQLVDQDTGKIMGESVNYLYNGGWVHRNYGERSSRTGCSRKQAGYFTDVLKGVFRPDNITHGGDNK